MLNGTPAYLSIPIAVVSTINYAASSIMYSFTQTQQPRRFSLLYDAQMTGGRGSEKINIAVMPVKSDFLEED